MALDMKYQALPDECELLELTQMYQDDEWLFSFWPVPRELRKNESPAVKSFREAHAKLLEKHKGIDEREYVTRHWDILLYLVSEKRRQAYNETHKQDIWWRIFIGGELLIKNGKVKFLAAHEVREAAKLLTKTNLDARWFDVDAMIDAKVYKSYQLSQSDETFNHLIHDFEKLKEVYRLAESHNEGMTIQLF